MINRDRTGRQATEVMKYVTYKDTYTKEEVDEMLMCELTELIQKYNTN